jgi:hypothetical protein
MTFGLETENSSRMIQLESFALFEACIPEVMVRFSVGMLSILMGF